MGTAVRYVAEVAGVREVSLLGVADLAYWRDRLAPGRLAPAEHEGAPDPRRRGRHAYRGLRFTEVSISALVSPPEPGAGPDAAFLVGPFTSSRLFALAERALFSTPYAHADCRLSTRPPVSLAVAVGGEPAFRAEMGAGPTGAGRVPSGSGPGGWEGAVFLPAGRRPGGPGRMFFARPAGDTRRLPFLPAHDTVVIHPVRDVFRASSTRGSPAGSGPCGRPPPTPGRRPFGGPRPVGSRPGDGPGFRVLASGSAGG